MAFLGFIILVVPINFILLALYALTNKSIFIKSILAFWIILAALFITSTAWHYLSTPKKLKKKDYYGQYVVDRNYFPGKQSDWQYDHFRFQIKNNDSIYFYCTENEKIIQTFSGKISTTTTYSSERLIINMQVPTHHIMSSNPTTYRKAWSFHLVFHSPKFNNMYFKKGKYKANSNY